MAYAKRVGMVPWRLPIIGALFMISAYYLLIEHITT